MPCICGKEIELVSQCCEADVEVSCGDEGPRCYICTDCGKACDVKWVSGVSFTTAPATNKKGWIRRLIDKLK